MLAMCQKLLDNAKQFATDAFKTLLKCSTQKSADATGDLSCNKIANKITKFPTKLRLNKSGTVIKDIYLQKKGNKLLMNYDTKQYNNGMSKNQKSFKKFTTNSRMLQIRIIKKYLKKYIYLIKKPKNIDNLGIDIIV